MSQKPQRTARLLRAGDRGMDTRENGGAMWLRSGYSSVDDFFVEEESCVRPSSLAAKSRALPSSVKGEKSPGLNIFVKTLTKASVQNHSSPLKHDGEHRALS